MLLQH